MLWVNKCKPDCAAGHYSKYPAVVDLNRVRYHHGQPYFTRMDLIWVTGSCSTLKDCYAHTQVYTLGRWGPA